VIDNDIASTGPKAAAAPEPAGRGIMTTLKFNVAHQVPGRIRMKIPRAKGDPEMLQQIAQTFAVIPGIEHIKVNPTTGSLVIHYDTERHDEFHGHLHRHVGQEPGLRPPTTEIDEFVGRIADEAEFLAHHSESARAIVDFFKTVDREIRTATDNNVDLTLVLAAGLIAGTILQVGATAATPVWVTLTLFALNHVIEMHAVHAEIAAAKAPVIVKA
jgi:hypothetical protein